MLFRVVAGAAAVFGSAEVNSDGPATLDQAKPFVAALYQRFQKDSIILENPSMIYSPDMLRTIQRQRNIPRPANARAFSTARDPLCNCTRYDVTSVKINITPLDDGRADAAVSFRNFGKPERVLLTLVDVNGEWRVDDVQNTSNALKKPFAPLASLAR